MEKIRIYITEGEIEDYEIFLEKLNRSGIEWEKTGPGDADVVIILAGLWRDHLDEIRAVLDDAVRSSRPVITVRPYGLENVPPELEEKSDEIVGWNPYCIADALEDSIQQKRTPN